jgi:cytochrome c2
MRPAARHLWAVLAIGGTALAACGTQSPNPIGDPRAGASVIERMSCGSCHRIPGIALADGRVGPSLATFGRQQLIAGTLPNSEPNLILWLTHPQAVRPGSLMPDMGLSDRQAHDVAAYLYELK